MSFGFALRQFLAKQVWRGLSTSIDDNTCVCVCLCLLMCSAAHVGPAGQVHSLAEHAAFSCEAGALS